MFSKSLQSAVQAEQQGKKGQIHWLRRQQQGLPHDAYCDTESDQGVSKECDI